MSGYVAVSRDVWAHPVFRDGVMTQREAFLWLIAEAAWKPRVKNISGSPVNLERGQLAHSVRFLAEAWSWSKSAVHRFLAKLEAAEMITKQKRDSSGTGVLVITLCNYAKYQDAESEPGQEAGQQRDSSGTNYNQGTNNSSSKTTSSPKSEAPKRAYRLPPDWQPPESFIEIAEKLGLSRQQALDQAERMRDWSQSAKTGAKLKWEPTYRNWIKRALDRGEVQNGQSDRSSNTSRHRSAFADALRADGSGSSSDEAGPSTTPASSQLRLVASGGN